MDTSALWQTVTSWKTLSLKCLPNPALPAMNIKSNHKVIRIFYELLLSCQQRFFLNWYYMVLKILPHCVMSYACMILREHKCQFHCVFKARLLPKSSHCDCTKEWQDNDIIMRWLDWEQVEQDHNQKTTTWYVVFTCFTFFIKALKY